MRVTQGTVYSPREIVFAAKFRTKSVTSYVYVGDFMTTIEIFPLKNIVYFKYTFPECGQSKNILV